MEYNRIVAVSGLPGLYEILSSKNDGALVRSVEDKSTKFIASRVHSLSHLESIEIYTTGENVNLGEVFLAMQDAGGTLPDAKDAAAVKAYFEKAFPALDTTRVYNSDMKKMVKWYSLLKDNGITFQTPQAEEAAATEDTPAAETASEASEASGEEKPKKAPARKKAAPAADLFSDGGADAEASADDEASADAKPKKKAAPKKKKEDGAE